MKWLKNVTDQELRQILPEGALGICASIDEGFGLPLREFISLGIPIVASNIPVYRENNYSGVVFFEIGNSESLTKAVNTQLSSPVYPNQVEIVGWNSTYAKLEQILKDES